MKEKKKMIIAIVLVVLLGILIFAIVKSSNGNSVTVTFNSHGGTEVETLKVKKGETIEEPEQPLKEGYEFIGWYYDGKKFDFTTELNKNIELEAKWLKVGTIKNTVTFDSAGGSSIDNQKVTKGEKVKKPTNPTRSGYTFVGWTLDGKTYDFNSKVEKNITLVAVWKQNTVASSTTVSKNSTVAKPVVTKPVVTKKVYTVTFYNDSTKISSIEVEEGKTINAPNVPLKENYIFSGWQTGGNVYDFNTPVTKNLDIYAIWKPILETATVATTENLKNDTVTRTAPNNAAIEVETESNQIIITKTATLNSVDSILNGGLPKANWVALSLNIGNKPASVEVMSDAVELAENQSTPVEAILDTDLMKEDSTDFIVWINVDAFEDTSKKLVFKDEEEIVIGTIAVKVDYQKLQAKPVTVVENSKVEISINENTITVLELPGATSTYQLIFDFGMNSVSVDGATISPVANSTAVTATINKTINEISFTNTLAPAEEDKITYTIVYQEVIVTNAYTKTGDVIVDSNYVVYNADGTFSVAATITEFTFTDDDVEMKALKVKEEDSDTYKWVFTEVID